MSRLTRNGTAEPVSRDQSLRHKRGQGIFSCSADHVQDWQPYPVDPYSCYMCDHTYIHVAHTHAHEGALRKTAKHMGVIVKGKLHECKSCSMVKGIRMPIPFQDTRPNS